jgi:hypothetical protein
MLCPFGNLQQFIRNAVYWDRGQELAPQRGSLRSIQR